MKDRKKFIVAIDQGTTSSRAILFNTAGVPIFKSQLEFKQYFPNNGWVEHNPEEIWKTTKKVLLKAINRSKKLKGRILTIGITNQRETTIMWDRVTGKPVYNAIVWQDRRTADFCNKFKSKKRERIINKKTGLLIDPYFSGTKIKWIIDNVLKAKKLLKKKQLLFGISQGGFHKDLRKKSARYINSLDFDGVAIGGVAIGEPKKDMYLAVKSALPYISKNKPRYVMGVGSPQDIVEMISLGVDCFDSIFPARGARHGTIFTSKGKIALNKGKYKLDLSPLDKECCCYTCKNSCHRVWSSVFIKGRAIAYKSLPETQR